MSSKPWYKVVTPREDLREGKPLDASEFAVHLDQIRDGRAPQDYQDPKLFFERTYMTKNLTGLASEVIRRLSGEKTETSAVFNMSTQFGGGKTHALTLLYHLATHGSKANNWDGVSKLLEAGKIVSVPEAATAVFVGTEFDSLAGRGGDDGTPLRRTAWGEIAYQLGGDAGFAVVAEHDEKMIAPAGDIIRKFLPDSRPCLILIDELMNYISRTRRSGVADQLYNFLQNLSEESRARSGTVLAVSIPASELEMSVADQGDHQRLKKLLDRLGKAIFMSSETETSEIVRRRLFEWDSSAVDQNGRIMLNREALATCDEYGNWVAEHRDQLPKVFDTENARQTFIDSYPFHPMVLSVFERKWQSLPRFQRTRGILRMLALWVSRAYKDGYEGAHRDALITLGTAPLEDPTFRAAVFEQLGSDQLETAVTADICGKSDAHAIQMDKEATEGIKKARLHRKVAATIFFESNGGQANAVATLPEIRLAVAEPTLDIGNVETVLDALSSTAYYLTVERNAYRFSLSPNLNKLLSDRRATIQPKRTEERVRAEVTEVFKKGASAERVYFPDKSGQIPDRPVLTIVISEPSSPIQDKTTSETIDQMMKECGTSARTFKSALIWAVPDKSTGLYEEAKKLLAWEAIESEASGLRLDDTQKRQLTENLQKARRDLKESVWRTYKNIILLNKDNTLRVVDLGLVHSSAADSMVTYLINRLKQDGDVTDSVSPNFLFRNWSPVYEAWSTKAVRDAFFASPQFPRLLAGDAIKETIAKGVLDGQFAYVVKSGSGYDPFLFNRDMARNEIEFADDVFILKKDVAEQYQESLDSGTLESGASGDEVTAATSDRDSTRDPWSQVPNEEFDFDSTPENVSRLNWSGEISSQKWSTFYQKVLMKYVADGLKITVSFEAQPPDGISKQKIDETKLALRELGFSDDVSTD